MRLEINASEAVEKQVLDFLLERAKFILRERRGFAYDEINAAFAAGADDLVDVAERVEALKAIRNTKNFAPLAASFKRIRNILEKSAAAGDKNQVAVNKELLRDPAEQQLNLVAHKIGEEVYPPEEGQEISRGPGEDFRAATVSGFLLRQSSSNG